MANNENIIKILTDAKAELERSIKTLESALNRRIDELNDSSKAKFKESNRLITVETENHEAKIREKSLKSKDDIAAQVLELKESINGQLESFREYTNKLVSEEEVKLVNSLEATLANVSDITNTQTTGINNLINQVTEVAEETTQKPVDIVKNRDEKVREELETLLTINKDELVTSINNLQEEYREKIAEQIEKVYMGVTLTKEEINEIIKDTLSRLEENLNRLTEGLDEHFSKEVGKTQDILHEYEGKLIQANTDIQENYNQQMVKILDVHSKSTLDSMSELKGELDAQKTKILENIKGLSDEQKKLIDNALSQLEGQISKSKADVIEFNGELKDGIQNTLKESTEIGETIFKKMQTDHNTSFTTLVKHYEEDKQTIQKLLTTRIDEVSKEVENDLKMLKKDVSDNLTTTKKAVKDYSNMLNKEASE